jgi:hypothetical protein
LLGVLAVLGGLVAMHGLGTASLEAPHARTDAAGHMTQPDEPTLCGHHFDAHGGGNAEHADATCASGGVGGGSGLNAPVMAGYSAPVSDEAVLPHPAYAAESGGRAPPSLSELQLLRI